ncbi:hypothetical protein C8J57DRAFT_1212130 [Mycena rebaudengoi]|nr:hypothetical protein C8J57DRAFT_1212130 [Mycena rebaudengoi]
MDPVPASDQLISHVDHGLRSRVPANCAAYDKAPSGPCCSKRRVVGIPVRASKLNHFNSDLAINTWIPFAGTKGSKPPRRMKVTHYLPSTRLLLKRAFTIIFVPPSRHASQPLNNNGSLTNTRPGTVTFWSLNMGSHLHRTGNAEVALARKVSASSLLYPFFSHEEIAPCTTSAYPACRVPGYTRKFAKW